MTSFSGKGEDIVGDGGIARGCVRTQQSEGGNVFHEPDFFCLCGY